MNVSKKKSQALYGAIHTAIADARIGLKIPAQDNVLLVRLISSIWDEQKRILGIKP